MFVLVMATMKKAVVVSPRGGNVKAVTQELLAKFLALPFGYTLTQVWTWKGGEMIVCVDHGANNRWGETRIFVRTGGLKRGEIRTLYVSCFKDAMEALGIPYRMARPPRIPTLYSSGPELGAWAKALVAKYSAPAVAS